MRAETVVVDSEGVQDTIHSLLRRLYHVDSDLWRRMYGPDSQIIEALHVAITAHPNWKYCLRWVNGYWAARINGYEVRTVPSTSHKPMVAILGAYIRVMEDLNVSDR